MKVEVCVSLEGKDEQSAAALEIHLGQVNMMGL